MNGARKVITSGLLPDIGLVRNLETIRIFSEMCEETCSNLFAFSPYQLHLEREEFLHFQYLADELKLYIDNNDSEFKTLHSLCESLNSVYQGMMRSCWDAFVCNPDINGDPGKFILQQQITVGKFDKDANACLNGF